MHFRQALLLPLLAAAVAYPVPAQRPGGNPAPAPSTNTNTAPGRAAPGASSPNTAPDVSFPVYVSGKVVVSDGSALPQNVSVVRVCANTRRSMGYLDPKGHFNVRVTGDANPGAFVDASESGTPSSPFGLDPSSRNPGIFGGETLSGGKGSTINPLLGCEIEISAPGFRSTPIDLSQRRSLDNPDVGTIVLTRIAGVEGTSVSATTYNAPKDAQKAYQKGQQLITKSKPDLAVKEFEKATGIYPKYAIAWLELGRAQVKLKDDAAAHDSFQKAIDAEPKLVDAWGELGLVLLRQKNWVEASQNLDRALRLNSVEYPALWFFDAVANFNAKNYDAAEKSAREAVKVDTRHDNPKADQILGLTLFQKQDLAGALDSLRNYLKYAREASDAAQVQAQITELENILAAKQPGVAPRLEP